MTTLLHDASAKLHSMMGESPDPLPVSELVYADDTLVVGVEPQRVQAFMTCIQDAGLNYGLSFNWRKLESLPVRCAANILKPDGTAIDQKDSIVYLGALLSNSGAAGPELNRRLGAARADFKVLARVWKHAALTRARKIEVFEACIVSKLLYCLHTLYLNKAELTELDAFQAKCLRQISGIPHSMISRVSNFSVLEQCGRKKLSTTMLQRQLMFMARIAQLPDDDVVRESVFLPSSFELKRPGGPRKRGRPRMCWANEVHKQAVLAAGGADRLQQLWQTSPQARTAWQESVMRHCALLR